MARESNPISSGHTPVAALLCSAGANVNFSGAHVRWEHLKFSPHDGLIGTPLAEAAARGDLETGKVLLQHGAKVDKSNILRRTPLYYAAIEGHLDYVNLLLAHGTSPTLHEKHYIYKNPLNASIRGGHPEILDTLLKAAGMLDSTLYMSAFYAAVDADNPVAVCRLLNAGGKIYYSWRRNNYQEHYSVLEHAAKAGRLDIVKLLLDRNPGLNQPHIMSGAIRSGQLELVEFLLDQGGDKHVNWQLLEDETFWNSNPQIVCQVIRRMKDRPPLERFRNKAFSHPERIPTLSCLEDMGLSFVSDSSRLTPLAGLAIQGRVDLMEEILGEKSPRNMMRGVEINRVGPGGHTALSWAIKAKQFESVRYLVENGAEINTNRNSHVDYLRTPLDMALLEGTTEIARYLESRGAAGSIMKTEESSLKKNLLDFYPWGGSPEKSNLWNACEHPSQKVNYLLPLLQMAVISGDSAITASVLARDDTELGEADYHLAFLAASTKGHAHIARMLMEARPSMKSTLFHHIESDEVISFVPGGISLVMAARNGHGEIVSLLTSDPFLKPQWSKHPFLLWAASVSAECAGHRDIADLIMNRTFSRSDP